RAKVGDRYVMAALHKNGWSLGGESSGHILCLDRTSTGDGIVSALQVLAAVVHSGRNLHELKQGMSKYPQSMINVRLQPSFDVMASSQVSEAVKQAEQELADKGRVLLRPSGTEPVVRVMVEGVDAVQVGTLAESLAATVSEAMAD
ncbi:MAG: phosphoglucosamine mutase, partial [Gammaproteobacteria bacterium]|nr:phosphoglucosamine mutase [Gammaproteobacteria bacterium]